MEYCSSSNSNSVRTSPNILVHFVDGSGGENGTKNHSSESSLLLQQITVTIDQLYGVDNFVVYRVEDEEFFTIQNQYRSRRNGGVSGDHHHHHDASTRIYTPAAVINIYNGDGNDNTVDHQSKDLVDTIPQVSLCWNQLYNQNSNDDHDHDDGKHLFNLDHFVQQIIQHIPLNHNNNKNKSNDHHGSIDNVDDVGDEPTNDKPVYLFDDSHRTLSDWTNTNTNTNRTKQLIANIAKSNVSEWNYDGDDHETMMLMNSPNDHQQNDIILINWRRLIASSLSTSGTIVPGFNVRKYFTSLRTKTLGRTVAFVPLITTTMDLATRFAATHGLIAVANYQTAGIGRNNNRWLSPHGCAMFTINLRIPFSHQNHQQNFLTNHLPLIQHLASLSLIKSMPSEELNLRIKWPNDILCLDNGAKLVGVLTRSYFVANCVNVQIGIGINLANRKPSICLNDLIEQYNEKNSSVSASSTVQPPPLSKLSKEYLFATILNNLEHLLYQVQYGGQAALDRIKQEYCRNWLHQNSLITVCEIGGRGLDDATSKSTNERLVRIVGINDDGYLLAIPVKNASDHNVVTLDDAITNQSSSSSPSVICLQPGNGNRFDLMHNLVVLSKSLPSPNHHCQQHRQQPINQSSLID